MNKFHVIQNAIPNSVSTWISCPILVHLSKKKQVTARFKINPLSILTTRRDSCRWVSELSSHLSLMQSRTRSGSKPSPLGHEGCEELCVQTLPVLSLHYCIFPAAWILLLIQRKYLLVRSKIIQLFIICILAITIVI